MNSVSYGPVVSRITEGYELFEEVFNVLLNSEYFNDGQKSMLKRLRKKLMKNRK